MYIPEFWCGVLVTIGIELIILFICIAYYGIKKGKNDEKENL